MTHSRVRDHLFLALEKCSNEMEKSKTCRRDATVVPAEERRSRKWIDEYARLP